MLPNCQVQFVFILLFIFLGGVYMKKNDFYSTSLELVKERIEHRLIETSNTPIENETDSIFDWMLSQLHWKMEGTHPVTKSCRIEFNGTTMGITPGLRYSYLTEYYPRYISLYEDFCSSLKEVIQIFNSHKNFSISSFSIPKRKDKIENLYITLEFSINS